MRKLASVQRVYAIEPIEGADRIELAHVLGWQCVVNKGKFKPGDLGIYFEVDSFLPVEPVFEFLRAQSYRNSNLMGEGFKLRTMRFKGQISQGLLLPLSDFPQLPEGLQLGADLTETLHVRKWEIEERATTSGTILGTLPASIPHTDETRIQAEPDLLGDFVDLEYYITTKMDGSSHSVSLDDGDFHVTGHNYEYKDDGTNSFYEIVKGMGLEERMRDYVAAHGLNSLTLQGELCAPGIQQNKLKLFKPEWYVFTVYENGKRKGLQFMQDLCRELELQMVPLEEVGKGLADKYPDIDALLKRADGQYPKGGPKEGIVIRPTEPVYSDRLSASLSFKVINNKYLLNQKD